MDDLLFVVYIDYETTAGDNVFNDIKMFVISYCQIYAFRHKLNFDRIVIFCSFQLNVEEIYDLNYFSESYIKYFDQVTFKQLRDAATNVL